MPKEPTGSTARRPRRITWEFLNGIRTGRHKRQSIADLTAPGLQWVKIGPQVYGRWRKQDPATKRRVVVSLAALPALGELKARAQAEGKSLNAVADDWLAEVRARAWALTSKARNGEDVKAPPVQPATVAQLADRYLTEHAEKHKRAASVADDRRMIEKVVKPKLGHLRVEAVTLADVERLHNSLRKTPYRANRVRSLLSKMFAKAKGWKLRLDNPVSEVKPYDEQPRQRYLSKPEFARLWEVLESYAGGPQAAKARAVKLIALTGARKGEVLFARWDQFDLERGVWTKPSAHTKQKREHRVLLIGAALDLLREMRDADGSAVYLFPGKGGDGPVGEEWLKTFWDEAREAAALPEADGKRFRLHDLRHTFASQLVSSGVSLPVIGDLLGHTQPVTTARYAHVADTAQRDALDRLAPLLPGSGE